MASSKVKVALWAAASIAIRGGPKARAPGPPESLTSAKVRSIALRVMLAVGSSTSIEIATLPSKVSACASGVTATS
jgi:hypothetical protein